MTKLELLNVFLNDRLTAAAEEIFRAVKDTVEEYQSEILRAKEENERLKRLLNVAVQRLLQHPEPLSIVPPLEEEEEEEVEEEEEEAQEEEAQALCEAAWRSGVELLPHVKEEPKVRNIQSDGSQEARDSEEGSCSRVEQLTASPPPPTPPTPPQIKTERGEDGGRMRQPSISFPSAHSNRRAAQSDSGSTAAKSHRTPKAEPPANGPLRSNGRQNTLPMKNTRSLKPPPRSAHPSQSIRWHSCKECGKGFSFACQLEVHMRWHTKEKPYSCTVCRKSFTTVSMLKRHHRIHTGEKPFRCHVCGKCFNQSAHLNTHFRLHTRERAGWSRAPHCK